MFLSKFSIQRPVTITMIILCFMVFGFLAFIDLPLNSMPDVSLPFVTVQTIYAGAGPQEIETLITDKIEDAVSTISQINYIESYSMDNVSIVLINFMYDKDVDIANQEVKDKVDAIINNLPEGIDRPIIGKFDMSAMPVMQLVLSGSQSVIQLYDYANNTLSNRLAQIPGVAQVTVSGGQAREIQIILNERTVFANNISLAQISGILAAHNVNLPGGSFKQAGQELSVRVVAEFRDIETIRNIEIPTAFGNKRLTDIAQVVDAGAPVRERTTFFDVENNIRNDNVISISLIKSTEGNPVDISNAINRQLRSINETLPIGMELAIRDDGSDFIKSSVDDTMTNIYLGIIFTGLILLFFLHDLRSTLIIALSMPISIISTFTFIQMSGFTLNIMSLLGLSTSIGILVANSVVVLENIFRHKEHGHGKKESADIGTSEVATAVLASTLTNLVVFLPIGLMGSIVGQMLREFGLTVVYATIFSLITAFTLTPMLASVILPEKKRTNKIADRIEEMITKLENFYQNILKRVLRRRLNSSLVVLGAILLFIFSLWVAAKVGFEFQPTMDQGNINVGVELPIGYTLEQTAEKMHEIEDIISQYSEVEFILTTLGRRGNMDRAENQASSTVKLIDAGLRDLHTVEVVDKMIRDLSGIANAKITVKASGGMEGGSSPITLYLTGVEDERLLQLSNEVIEKIRDIPGLVNLDTSTRSGRPELIVEPKRDQLALIGITVQELAIAVRAAVEGLVATQYRELGNEYEIKVTMDEDAYNTPERLRNLTVVTSRGRFQLSQLAEVRFAEGINRIIHRNKSKAITITGAPATGVPMGDVTGEITRRMNDIHFPDGYRYSWGGSAEMMQDAISEMARAAILAILLTYMLLAAILESFIQPFLILATIPLALIGVFFIQFATGLTMNIVSMMAIIMLIGIVVNNAILLLDYTNQLRAKGQTCHDALLEASPTKLKPILMSNIAIILGMLPMAMGIGSAGAEFRQAMGVVSIGGIIGSTLLTLIVIPALYYLTTRK